MLDWKMMKIGLIKKVFFLVFPLPETNVLFTWTVALEINDTKCSRPQVSFEWQRHELEEHGSQSVEKDIR